VKALRLARIADSLIAHRRLSPLIIVMPVAGRTGRYDGEWTSVWEDFVVRNVVPWVDAHLPAIPGPRGRILGGMSAGGYGAVDIALRHPRLFGAVESWSGYFRPLHDGSLRHAGEAQLAAHDPSLLVQRVGPVLRNERVRFYLSSGTTGDWMLAAAARRFAAKLRYFGVPVRLVLRPGGHTHRFWRAQLPAALRFAAPAR
jgi:enterochelin esterase-like enzyme